MNEQTLPWLNRANYKSRIGEFPESFSVETKLASTLERVVASWLTDLIGQKTVSDILADIKTNVISQNNQLPEQWSQSTKDWMALIIPFLVHASWSEFIVVSNVTITVNGPVTVHSDGSDPISDQQRSSIARVHKGYADMYALKLAKKATLNECSTERAGSGRPSLRSAGGKRQSRFD
ncbi:DUF6712 family protein [Spirosoma agri]|uniref:Uncharacterized protein n=1 Tax=Spirosoma agri TaxID=1987381 RepID=A0A6M0II99_9BACT|nr:hypothetical protein [Spirosoma agri]NEU67958.1 hypothetical protein [Spirosoma agri]